MPTLGPNTRLTQSMPGRSPAAVTTTQRVLSAATAARSGRRARTVSARSNSTTTSTRVRATARTDRPSSRPSVAAIEGGMSCGTGGSAGKSISIQPCGAEAHTKGPLRVWKVAVASEHVRGGQGGVAAQVDLDRGREPAQVVGAIGARHDEGRLRQVHLTGHELHLGFVGKARPRRRWRRDCRRRDGR